MPSSWSSRRSRAALQSRQPSRCPVIASISASGNRPRWYASSARSLGQVRPMTAGSVRAGEGFPTSYTDPESHRPRGIGGTRMSDQQPTSLTLLERARANESAAWERLLHLYRPLVLHWCSRGGVTGADADDVSQD